MYESLVAENITFVSVGHRPSLLAYHSSKLVLRGPGEVPVVVALSGTDADLDIEGLNATPAAAKVESREC